MPRSASLRRILLWHAAQACADLQASTSPRTIGPQTRMGSWESYRKVSFDQSFMANCFFFSLLCVCLALAATSGEGKSRSLADHIAAIPPF